MVLGFGLSEFGVLGVGFRVSLPWGDVELVGGSLSMRNTTTSSLKH